MADFGTFVTGQVLTAAELNAAGAYTAYTPTFGGFTLGNGVVSAGYTKFNKLVHYLGTIDLGTTSTMTGPFDIALPFACNTTRQPIVTYFAGNVDIYNGATVFLCKPLQISSTSFRVVVQNASTTYVTNTDVTATIPATWSSAFFVYWNFVYEAA